MTEDDFTFKLRQAIGPDASFSVTRRTMYYSASCDSAPQAELSLWVYGTPGLIVVSGSDANFSDLWDKFVEEVTDEYA